MTEKTKKKTLQDTELELEGRLLRVCEKVVVVFQHEIGQKKKRGGTQAEKNTQVGYRAPIQA